jgi:hypothetical protein
VLLGQGPAIPIEAPILAPLASLLACLIALGLVLVAHKFISALFGTAKGIVDQTIGRIPWIGGKVAGALHRIEQRFNGYMTSIIEALEGVVAHSWHTLASAVSHLGYTIAHVARAVARVAWYVESRYSLPALLYRALKALHNTGVFGKILHRVESLAHTLERVIYRPLSQPLRAAVHAGTAGLAGELDRLGDWTIPRVRSLTHEVASIRGLTRRLLRWLRRHERLLAAGAMTAAVAFALSRLGATWIRCGNWRKAGRAVCGMPPSLLDDLLAGLVAILGTISIVEFAKETQAVTEIAESGLRFFVRELHGLEDATEHNRAAFLAIYQPPVG